MHGYSLTIRGKSVRSVESHLRRYLPGLDARLEQYSPRQAILAGHLMLALQREYSEAGAHSILNAIGVDKVASLSDESAVLALHTRALKGLTPRPNFAAAAVGAFDWHLEATQTTRAWGLLNGPDEIDWTGVRVGQIDTGYTLHPVFGFPEAPWVDVAQAETYMPDPPHDGPTDPPAELGHGLDNPYGYNGGHGTKMGSTITGSSSTNAFFGVAPRCPLVPVRICNVVLINSSQGQFELAVRHLVDVAQVRVINVSLGVFPAIAIKAMKRAVDYAYANGVIIVCAAGNWVNSVVAPANLRRTLAIGGVTSQDTAWSGTSHGPQVDLSAPAADMRSAATSKGDKFKYVTGGDGTSYATAMVTGAAALWLAYHQANLAYDKPWQVVEAFKSCARTSARRPDKWQRGALGEGILDVFALLSAPLPKSGDLTMDAANV